MDSIRKKMMVQKPSRKRIGRIPSIVESVGERLLYLGLCGIILILYLRFFADREQSRRRLEEAAEEDTVADGGLLNFIPDVFTTQELIDGAVILHLIGTLYMFLAIAIVCDEFFVPTLEEITETLDLRSDVAGATFMAAGGSAPEFFTALIGYNLSGEEPRGVGLGTIIGSAVFNVLFVIGACAYCSPEPMVLSWWPLARDCSFYCIDLIMLTIFFSDGWVTLPEAIIMFGLYLSYVFFMKHSEHMEIKIGNFFARINGKDPIQSINGSKDEVISKKSSFEDGMKDVAPSNPGVLEKVESKEICIDSKVETTPGQIPAGDVEPAPIEIENKNSDAIETDLHAQTNSNEDMGKGCTRSNSTPPTAFDEKEIKDLRQNAAFTNRQSIRAQITPNIWRMKRAQTFSPFSGNVAQNIQSDPKLGALFAQMNAEAKDHALTSTIGPSGTGEAPDNMNFASNPDPSEPNPCAETEEEDEEEAAEWLVIEWPSIYKDSFYDVVKFLTILPILVVLLVTVPDVRNPAKQKYFVISFFLSILWIAIFTTLMLSWGLTFALIIGVPEHILGLTLLACGTSIPDFITSVVVARQGHGDMAVSSSVGSNIFDITVGLPIPWIIYLAKSGKDLPIDASNIEIQIVLLLLMVAFLVATIKLANWQLSASVGK